MIPGLSRSRIWLGLPLGTAVLAGSGYVLTLVFGWDRYLVAGLAGLAFLATLALRLLLRRWSWVASQLLATAVLSAIAYLVYACALTVVESLGALGLAVSSALLLVETCALALSIYYVFEMLDVLGRREQPLPPPPADYLPVVALQVPTYDEPVDVVAGTLEALSGLDYPRLLVQVVDNNTTDPALWRPIEDYCRRLGPRFSFLHLENWPGYKAGALNEATRRLPEEVEVIGVVDSDYTVNPHWLRDVAGYFADPRVAFVQTPQEYRGWEDEPYLRGLYYSYRYFFALSMPARAHRNAIIFAGTMGLLRRSALEAIGGWDETCITEDAETSLRLLGRGWSGIYVPQAGGEGMMPLTFDGLKKQRFRWALGGIQILHQHWRDLLGIGKLRLTLGQRLHYLAGGLHWFGDLLQVFFTMLLLATAVAVALHHRLPVRQVTVSVLAIPLALLVTGLARALWALRASTGCRWRDALWAMRIWFALSWITALACVRGLIRAQTAFLRTPKAPEGGASWMRALAASRTESLIALATAGAGVAMLVRSPSIATAVLAVFIAWQASVYANAPLVGMASEGIKLTAERLQFLQSSQSTGERVATVGKAIAIPSAALAVVVVVLLAGGLVIQPGTSAPLGPLFRPPAPGIQDPPPNVSRLLPSPGGASPSTGTPGGGPSSQPSPGSTSAPGPGATPHSTPTSTGAPGSGATASPASTPAPASTPQSTGTGGGASTPPASTPTVAPTPRATGTP